jgi:hypothetical protein
MTVASCADVVSGRGLSLVEACVERRPSNVFRKREKMRIAHISEMRSNKE